MHELFQSCLLKIAGFTVSAASRLPFRDVSNLRRQVTDELNGTPLERQSSGEHADWKEIIFVVKNNFMHLYS